MGLFHSLIQKRVRKFLLVLPFLLTSCNYFNADFHRPVNIFEAYFLFKDSAGALYFEFEERLNGSFFKYGGQKNETWNYYDYVSIDREDDFHFYNIWMCRGNNEYLFLSESSGDEDHVRRIVILDKKLEQDNALYLENGFRVYDMACTNSNLYWTELNTNSGVYSLKKYNTKERTITVLQESVSNSVPYIDDDVHLIFIDNRIEKQTEKTSLIVEWGKDAQHILSSNLDISMLNDEFKINDNGSVYHVKKDNDCNRLYDKAYAFGDIVLFASYEYVKSKYCLPAHGCRCVCGLKASYIYSYNRKTKETSLLEEFDKGTFLVDYDLEGAKYYYDGGLYINNKRIRDCERIEPGELESFSRLGSYGNEYSKESYYISFYNNEFYGV